MGCRVVRIVLRNEATALPSTPERETLLEFGPLADASNIVRRQWLASGRSGGGIQHGNSQLIACSRTPLSHDGRSIWPSIWHVAKRPKVPHFQIRGVSAALASSTRPSMRLPWEEKAPHFFAIASVDSADASTAISVPRDGNQSPEAPAKKRQYQLFQLCLRVAESLGVP